MKSTFIRVVVLLLLTAAGYGVYYAYANAVSIKSIALNSPENSALKAEVTIELNTPASVYIEYWKDGSADRLSTPSSREGVRHSVNLLLLEPGSTYHYQVKIDRMVDISSKVFDFETRQQSPWMKHDWIKAYNPHDSTAVGDGLVMLCYRGFPGYIAMVDGKGDIRWYWQDEKLGVRLASLTPRNTILALLAPANKDEFKVNTRIKTSKNAYYLRNGKIGFVGGTQVAEIDLTGKVLWRLDLEKMGMVLHHDIQMNKQNQIVSIFRDLKLYDKKGDGTAIDSLWGDGVVVMDSTGHVVKKWSAWDVWDIKSDKRLDSLAHDRFHFNTVSFDRDSNYLLSTPIENQIWKVDARTGKLLWKLGKGGDFKMDKNAHFSFQHASHINHEGDLMLFDNGDFSPGDTSTVNKVSRALSFKLDTVTMTATTRISASIPKKQYTARMGSAYLLPNGNILQTSSKTGGVLITNNLGKVLWELNSHFIPYRAEYVPSSLWTKYVLVD